VTRFRLTLAYDGTDFEGWQSQSRARPVRTVQDVLEAALGRLARGEGIRVTAAGRTDAGVHALGQVVSFALPRAMPPGDLGRALNGLLPDDVRVLDVSEAPPGFHARRTAVSKLYRYCLDTGPVQLPGRRRLAGHVPVALDQALMAETAALFLGTHDFAALASAGGTVKTTVRTVTRSDLRAEGIEGRGEASFVYETEADGFLRKMVRSMVGGLVAAGRGAVSVDALGRALRGRDRRAWPAPAPACGLCLVRVDYP
jgi:tRNA pseudouridine38-40 synthase